MLAELTVIQHEGTVGIHSGFTRELWLLAIN
jgi:hypothetical protein